MGNLPQQNRHWPASVQQEYCDLCGRKIPAAERIQGDSQGLYQRWLCPECAPLGQNPSYVDYGGPGNQAPLPEAPEPHSGVDWIGDDQDENASVGNFYAGALATAAYAADVALSSALGVRAVPFSLPDGMVSNTLSTVTIYSSGYTGNVKVAIYRNATNTTNVGTLLADLGTEAIVSGGTAEFSAASLFLAGDAVYYVALYGTGVGTLQAFADTDSDDTLSGASSIRSPATWKPVPEWSTSGGAVPWTRLQTNFFKILLTLEA